MAARRARRPRPGPLALALILIAVVLSISLALFSARADDTNAFSPIVSYQYFDSLDEPGASNTVMSAVVSYQYQDSLSEPGAETTLISPIVSYQYYDWPGDENVLLQSSPKVSYFYGVALPGANVAVHGRVVNALGQPVASATVSASILEISQVTTQTAADGSYELPPLAPGVFVLAATKSGQATDKRVVTVNANLAPQHFQLVPLTQPSALQNVNSAPPAVPSPADLEGSVLRVFNGTSFVTDLSLLNTNKMTVVLTHGWIICGDPGGINYWPKDIARALLAAGLTSDKANIVGWDWLQAARPCFPPNPPEEKTPKQGLALGKALYQALGTNYAQKIHFLGHSLGALVNARAANYLHGHALGREEVAPQAWNSQRTHLTLFDEAELARLTSKEVFYDIVGGYLTGDGIRLALSAAETVAGWKSPVPANSAWVDNYISVVGIYHADAVNIALQKAIPLTPSLAEAHSYPQRWYSNSIAHPTTSVLGFQRSFEYRLLPGGAGGEFPSGGISLGSTYHQTPGASDELVLEPHPFGFGLTAEIAANYVVDRIEDNVVNPTIGAARKVGQVTVSVVNQAAIGVSHAVNSVVSEVGQVVDLLNRPGLRIYMTTGLPPNFAKNKFGGNNLGPPDTNSPAYVWLPIAVPADAAGMAFDFTITGDGQQDSLAFGINGTNLFALETKFVADGEVSTSRLIDVSAYAGTTNEFFFGIVGGSSTECAVTIEGIRFFTLALPALTIQQTNGVTQISWSSSANGFVLESTPSLSALGWTPTTNAPSLFNGRLSQTNGWPEAARFFRLHRL